MMLNPRRSSNSNSRQPALRKQNLSVIVAAVAGLSLLIPFQILGMGHAPANAQAQQPEKALKCYPITAPRVTVKDQFGTEAVSPGPTQWLCEAALKHSDVKPTGSHQWKMYTIAGTINPKPVTLKDQFGTESVDPAKGSRLLNPALKNDKGNLQDTHMKGYPIAGYVNPPPVKVADQFGIETVDPRPATLLITPALKNGAGDLASPHWKCYPISGAINPPVVTLTDQFGIEKVDPKQANLLCTLTEKSHTVTGSASPEPIMAAVEE